jgi:hypothetical protein
MTTEKLIRMARDWQAIATREAAEFLGTPEGAARLVEAKRYGLLADALATQRQAEPVDDGDYYSEEADDIEKSRDRAALSAAPQWVSVEDQMPKPGRPVLAVYTTHHEPPRQRVNRAHWMPAKFEEADSEADHFEYDEETDTNWTPPGWYEQMDHWGEYSSVAMSDVTVTHWMPLPQPPAMQKDTQ